MATTWIGTREDFKAHYTVDPEQVSCSQRNQEITPSTATKTCGTGCALQAEVHSIMTPETIPCPHVACRLLFEPQYDSAYEPARPLATCGAALQRAGPGTHHAPLPTGVAARRRHLSFPAHTCAFRHGLAETPQSARRMAEEQWY